MSFQRRGGGSESTKTDSDIFKVYINKNFIGFVDNSKLCQNSGLSHIKNAKIIFQKFFVGELFAFKIIKCSHKATKNILEIDFEIGKDVKFLPIKNEEEMKQNEVISNSHLPTRSKPSVQMGKTFLDKKIFDFCEQKCFRKDKWSSRSVSWV